MIKNNKTFQVFLRVVLKDILHISRIFRKYKGPTISSKKERGDKMPNFKIYSYIRYSGFNKERKTKS